MKKLIYIAMFLLLPIAVMAETENLITISANGVRKTYLLSAWKNVTVNKQSVTPQFNVSFNDGTATATSIKSVLFSTEKEPKPAPEEVVIETTESSAVFTWPTIEGVASYQLIIYKDEACTERVCTLTFNSNGQLVNIDFSTDGSESKLKSALASISFTVTGLTKGSEYQYTLGAYNSFGEEISNESGSFCTKSEVSADGTNAQLPQIYSVGKTIVVDCPSTENITFHTLGGDALGECVVAEHCECTVTLPGVYVVEAGTYRQKILVK